ncbi:MAG: gluconolactonase [Scytolyngbya sp. HA4215-MV1]|jgi:sugar lactone lactonase YvrE|nr:gluconolactonase [Scytolyngbya sp. HA4215-MV1]
MSSLPPLFANVPVEQVPIRLIAEFPPNTFLESIAIDPSNTLFVTSHFEGKVFRIAPDGKSEIYAAIAGKATGLVLTPEGNLLLTGWDEQNVCTVFQITTDGTVSILVQIPDAIFLNGITPLTATSYLIADSYRGAIWQLEVIEPKVSVWLEHSLLARSSPDKELPAVNGLKRWGKSLYASNTEKQLVIRIPISDDFQPGEPDIFISRVNLDDFAFDLDGNLYGTTHVFNSVVKISPEGQVTILAQAEAGMVGSTALAFGQAVDDRTGVYVVTNGGMSLPLPSGLEAAKVVRLEVGVAGLPLIVKN